MVIIGNHRNYNYDMHVDMLLLYLMLTIIGKLKKIMYLFKIKLICEMGCPYFKLKKKIQNS